MGGRSFKNPFEELGLTPAAVKVAGEAGSLDIAKAAFRHIASAYRHPDRGGKASDYASVIEAMRLLQDPITRKEFYEEYAGSTKTARAASQRAQIHELELEKRALQGRISQLIESAYVPGSLANLMPETKLLIAASGRNSYQLLRIDSHGILQTQYARSLEGDHREMIYPCNSGQTFVVTNSGTAYSWYSSRKTDVEDGMWLVGPSNETETQYVYPLEVYGKEVDADMHLVLALDFPAGAAGETRAVTKVVSVLNEGVARSQRENHVSGTTLGGASEYMTFEPVLGSQLIAGRVTRHNPLVALGRIAGGVITSPAKKPRR